MSVRLGALLKCRAAVAAGQRYGPCGAVRGRVGFVLLLTFALSAPVGLTRAHRGRTTQTSWPLLALSIRHGPCGTVWGR